MFQDAGLFLRDGRKSRQDFIILSAFFSREKIMKKQMLKVFFRWFFYVSGLVLLALGLTLNTKAGLETGAVVTVTYTLSVLTGRGLGYATLIVYLFFVILRLILDRGRNWQKTLLQILLSFAFSYFMEFFSNGIHVSLRTIWQRTLLLVTLVITGAGVSMSVAMRLVPNPADGLAHSIGDVTGKGTGTRKNILDGCCVGTAFLVGLAASQPFMAIGVGTLFSMVIVGRIVALFNRFFQKKLESLSGLSV